MDAEIQNSKNEIPQLHFLDNRDMLRLEGGNRLEAFPPSLAPGRAGKNPWNGGGGILPPSASGSGIGFLDPDDDWGLPSILG